MKTVRLNARFEAELEKITEKLGLSTADVIRIGLTRVFEEFKATGKIELKPHTIDLSKPKLETADMK